MLRLRDLFSSRQRESQALNITYISCLTLLELSAYIMLCGVYGMHMQRFTDNLYHGPLPDSYLLHCVWSG